MNNYLIVATRQDTYSSFNAILLKRENGFDTFDLLESSLSATPEITNANVSTTTKGVIKCENITSDIENLMRALGFKKCDECGNWILPQHCLTSNNDLDEEDAISNSVSYYDSRNHKRYCLNCLLKKGKRKRKLEIRLANYHTTGARASVINGNGENFTLENVKGCGIEMEYCNGTYRNTKISCTEDFYEVANPRSRKPKVFRCEQDRTVGGEFISNVFTKKSLYDFNWEILTNELKLLKNDEKINGVGFHVHFSKTLLGDSPKEQAQNFLKLQYFLKSYSNDFIKISGREISDTNWCGFYTMDEITRMKSLLERASDVTDVWSTFTSSHSYCLINSASTIELRIGHSTNDPVKIANYLKLTFGMVENIKNVPFDKVYCLGKVFKLVPNEVMNYWRSKGAFLSTNAKDIRGFEFTTQQAQ